jgi:hypothetical protein
MFARKHLVAYITSHKIWLDENESEKPTLIELDWDGFDPAPAFRQIREVHHADTISLILGYHLSFVGCCEVPKDTITNEFVTAAIVRNHSQQSVPLDIAWTAIAENNKAPTVLVQYVAAATVVLNNLSYAAKVTGLRLVEIIPIQAVLAEPTTNVDTTCLILWGNLEKIAVVARQGYVLGAENMLTHTAVSITQLLDFVLTKLNVQLNTALIDWHPTHLLKVFPAIPSVDKQPTLSSQWNVQTKNLNIMVRSMKKKESPVIPTLKPVSHPQKPAVKTETPQNADLTEPNVLVTEPAKKSAPELIKNETSTQEAEVTANESAAPELEEEIDEAVTIKINKKLLFISGIAFIVGLTGLSGFLLWQGSNSQKKNVSSINASPSPLPTSSPEAKADFSPYTLQILNGSGIVGAAGKLKDTLTPLGFKEIMAGNADRTDYTQNTIQAKSKVLPGVVAALEKELAGYLVTKDPLADSTSYDLVIIIGSKE